MALLTQNAHWLTTHPTSLPLTAGRRPPPGGGQPLQSLPPPGLLPHPAIPKAVCLRLSLTTALLPPRSPSSPSPGSPNQPCGVGGGPGTRDLGLRIWKGLVQSPLPLSVLGSPSRQLGAPLPKLLAVLGGHCSGPGRALQAARGYPARCPQDPTIGGPIQAASPPPVTRSQLQRAPSWMWAPPHAAPLPLVGCQTVVGQTNQEPES